MIQKRILPYFILCILILSYCTEIKNTGFVSIIIYKKNSPNLDKIQNYIIGLTEKEYYYEMNVHGFIGQEVLLFEFSRKKMNFLNLAFKSAITSLEKELGKSAFFKKNLENYIIAYKKEDILKNEKYKDIKYIAQIPIEISENLNIQLSQVAAIKIELSNNDYFYNKQPAYRIDIKYHTQYYNLLKKDMEKLNEEFDFPFEIIS